MNNSPTASKGGSRAASHVAQTRASCLAGRYRDAQRHADKALKHPDTADQDAYFWAASAYMGAQNWQRGRELVGAGLEKFPDSALLLSLQGGVLAEDGEYDQANAMLRRCVEIDPRLAIGWIRLSSVLFLQHQYVASRDAALKALELEPEDIFALTTYASAMKEMGYVREAVEALGKISELYPDTPVHRPNLLFTMLFDEKSTPQTLRAEAETYAGMLARKRHGRKRQGRPPASGRIRVGLISNDLYAHACAYFIIPFLTNLDHERFEVSVFSLNGRKDNVTTKIRLYADHFVDLAGKSESEIVSTLDAAGMDVLFDLGGYTTNSPLVYLAYSLAPVQVTWMGYPSTTGMAQVQYRISDWIGDPAGNEGNYTEQLLRAPVIASVYYPLVATPLRVYEQHMAVQETPALKNGFVTFGCCINLAKVSQRTLRLWSAVLARCPDSKLLLECSGLEKEEVRHPLLHRMEAAGIAAERVICVPRSGLNQYRLYNQIDVVLDTAPMTGGANTCDALWMGVPVVTLAGTAFHERISASCVHAIGLDGLSCGTEEEYVEVAASLASDPAGLNALRLSMRARFEQSPLFDAPAFTRWLEAEMTGLVGQYREVPPAGAGLEEGVFFDGQWHPMEEIVLAVVSLLQERNYLDLNSLLENISAKWSRHWLVAFALAEMAHESGNKEWSLDLLIESAALRKFSLPLYRLLSQRLDECGRDKSVLDQFLQQSFGLDLAYLDRQPVPSIAEIAGVKVLREDATA
ncbi:hypothetical protein AB4Z48_10905 [Cupriavidus sp. 2TAF22]|uniref:O-linked N-acetylglucosamine transferase, SPINDLY family protein n=1 Tax=unclassified Cupriavidus TaxID=2640874 RepID=UPI003F8DE767